MKMPSVRFNERMLKEAVIRADKYVVAALPLDHEIDHIFSKEFEKKMQVLIRGQKYESKKLSFVHKRISVVVIIVMLLTAILGVTPVRAKVFEFITKVYEKYTHILFQTTNPSPGLEASFEPRLPEFVPGSFKLVHWEVDGSVSLVYERNGDFISYDQTRLSEVSMDINTEGVDFEDLQFHGMPAKYYSNQGVQNLILYDDEYLYMVSSTLV